MTGIPAGSLEFVADVDYASLDPRVVERTRMLLTDQVGISIRGRNDAGLSAPMAAALRHLGLGSGNASVIGDAAVYSPPAAALFNGNLGHSLDFDDTHASGSIHPSAPIVPAALAAAEMVGANGRTVVAAVVAGYEVQIRLSLALGPSDHYRQGFTHATCGVYRGAAAGRGRRSGDACNGGGSDCAAARPPASMQFPREGVGTRSSRPARARNGSSRPAWRAKDFRGAREASRGRAGFLQPYSAARESTLVRTTALAKSGNAADCAQAVSVLPVQAMRRSMH